MVDLANYFMDGANAQAKAVLAFLQYQLSDNGCIEDSWNKETKRYEGVVTVARWENCREQGYVVMLKTSDYRHQLNIAFFEHRNSDSICAVKWEQVTMNTPTIETAEFGDVYKDKYDVSKEVGYGKAFEMAKWIVKQFEEFWEKNSKKDLVDSK